MAIQVYAVWRHGGIVSAIWSSASHAIFVDGRRLGGLSIPLLIPDLDAPTRVWPKRFGNAAAFRHPCLSDVVFLVPLP